VEYTVSKQQMGRGVVEAYRVPAPPFPWPQSLHVEVLEDGRPLGPEVEGREAVVEEGDGAFAVVVREGSGIRRYGVVYFSASDGSKIRANGRQYVVRHSRWQLPAAFAFVLVLWTVFPLSVLRLTKVFIPSARDAAAPIEVGAWSVLVAGSLYSVFAAQAWLPPSNVSWLLLVVTAGVAPFLANVREVASRVPGWLPWIAGFGVWAAATSFGGSSYASPGTAMGFLAVMAGGILLYFGLRGSLQDSAERGPTLLFVLFCLTVVLSLAREAGFGVTSWLASLELSPVWKDGLVNSWTTKFLSHWTLVVAWCTFAALSNSRRGRRWSMSLVAVIAVLTIAMMGSKSAIVAFGLSGLVALTSYRWKSVRHVVIAGLVGCVLFAPLWAAVPWRVGASLPTRLTEGPLSGLEMDARGGVWEFGRKLVLLRPLRGWGFGASVGLPAREVPMTVALDLDPETTGKHLSREAALPGGHPHNAALLTWLDLGLIGSLLLAGLIWSTGRSIGAVEDRQAQASLLGVLTANACILAFNYPAWQPEIQSILWMSGVLGAALLPRPAVRRRELLLTVGGVFLVLVLGGVSLAQGRVERWLTIRELRANGVVLRPQEGVLAVGDEAREVVYDERLNAEAELMGSGAGEPAIIRGWAFGPPGVGASAPFLVFVGSDLAGVVWPELPSPGLFAQTRPRDVRALVSGFLVPVDPEHLDLEAPVTIGVLQRGRIVAKELPPLSGATTP